MWIAKHRRRFFRRHTPSRIFRRVNTITVGASVLQKPDVNTSAHIDSTKSPFWNAEPILLMEHTSETWLPCSKAESRHYNVESFPKSQRQKSHPRSTYQETEYRTLSKAPTSISSPVNKPVAAAAAASLPGQVLGYPKTTEGGREEGGPYTQQQEELPSYPSQPYHLTRPGVSN